MFEACLMVLGGFVLLGAGGAALVNGSVSLAKKLKVPPLIIGLTLVAFGTSAPELMVSVNAALDGQPDIAIGNVVGSNIANILLVLGATALVRPILVDVKSIWRDVIVMFGVTVGFVFIAIWGRIDFNLGALMLFMIVVYVVYVYRHEKNKTEVSDAEQEVESIKLKGGEFKGGILASLSILIIGIAVVVWGADILVNGAVRLAQGFGVPEAVIGLSVVAIGTSLPELVISVLAAIRGHAGVAIGNVVGSNISNILLILGVTGMIEPLTIASQIAQFDVWIMLLASFGMVYLLTGDVRITRRQGGICVAAYTLYIAFLYIA